MKLQRSTRISEIKILNVATRTSAWVFVASCKIVERYGFLDFYVFNETLSSVCAESSCVKLNLERVRTFKFDDFDGLSVIDFSHAFNFGKLNIVIFLVWVALILVDCNCGLLFAGNLCNY